MPKAFESIVHTIPFAFPFEETDGLEPGNENEAVAEDATDGLNVSEAGRNV